MIYLLKFTHNGLSISIQFSKLHQK